MQPHAAFPRRYSGHSTSETPQALGRLSSASHNGNEQEHRGARQGQEDSTAEEDYVPGSFTAHLRALNTRYGLERGFGADGNACEGVGDPSTFGQRMVEEFYSGLRQRRSEPAQPPPPPTAEPYNVIGEENQNGQRRHAAFRGRHFPRAARNRAREPEVQEIRGSSSAGSSDEDEDEDGDEDQLPLEPSTTRLSAEKDCFDIAEEDVYSFAMWVEVEGKECEVYDAEEKKNVKEGWIVSERGKHYKVNVLVSRKIMGQRKRDPFPDMNFNVSIDGKKVEGYHLDKDDLLGPGRKVPYVFDGRKVSPTERRLFRFAAPVLTEETTPKVNVQNVGVISAKFERSTPGREKQVATPKKKNSRPPKEIAASDLVVGKINEVQKSGTLIGAVTEFGDSVAVKPSKRREFTISGYRIHPEDEDGCFYELRLRYAPKDMLQAAGTVPLDIKIAEGEPGLKADHPIKLDDTDQIGDEVDSVFVRQPSGAAPQKEAQSAGLGQGLSRTATQQGFTDPAQREGLPDPAPPAGPSETAVADGQTNQTPSEGQAEKRLCKIAQLEARRQERLAQEQRDQEMLERLQAGDDVDELDEDVKPVGFKRSASEEIKVKEEYKKCKVTVKEEVVDGVMVFEIQDD